MNAILGMLKLLHGTDLNARQLDYTSKAESAAQSLLGLLNDILDFSKIDAGKMTLDPQPFELDRLLRDLSVILSSNLGNKPVEVLFDIDPTTPKTLIGDALRLQQVLINLSGNAIKFTAQGEVVLQIKVLSRSGADTLLRIAVRDSGIGIAPENQQHIFDGFSQAEASTTRRFGGTGLGLSISKRLVTLMGGELALDSVLGQGSTFHFTITLPVAEQEINQQRLPAPRQPGPLNVLIADDNAVARELLGHMARSWGWQVDLAANGAQAIERVQVRAQTNQAPYQAIFMDWEMPGMDGWETLTRLRQTLAGSAAPISVMVTAHGRDALSQRSAQERASLSAYLVKPITASMLYDVVAEARAVRSKPRASSRASTEKIGRLQGMRLLVVEDNLINQQVARELLKREGALVEIVDNGLLGVTAVAQANGTTPFDAVLMDLQMPVMDGFAATYAIRHELGLTTLPVIAMTANAMASDREACLAAGMNEHVGKPFNLTHLVTLLLAITGFKPAAAPSTYLIAE
jgi:CheY-like chemotaxis protein